ncbi:MAG TPA: hypothetical protein VFZ09_17620 [Archangium sp.]|uniref:hypothetical protein n=1 Tax=Archangium sp. TaxID=1872627 RepID=UPI002E36026E|nr:hypothetical protein [Archangium sp.]HEX5748065.1 hypothetical protein [Archangium sp.]
MRLMIALGAAALLVGCPGTEGDGGNGADDVCVNPPVDLAVPFKELSGVVAHWALSAGCIQTSYAPDMKDALPEFEAALAAWDAQACSDLCFTAPVESTVPAEDSSQRRVHLVSGRPAGVEGYKVQTTLTLRLSTGRLLQSVIYVDTAAPGAVTRGDWLTAVGKALGIGTPAEGVDSVMSREQPQPRTALTGKDIETFCRLYGRPTFCGN